MTLNTSWDKLSLDLLPPIKSAIKDLGFKTMTPVQAACIPLINVDLAVEAVTGSGKTLAFLVPLMQTLLKVQKSLKKHDIGALIISPTRELASQTHEVLQAFLKHAPKLSSSLLVGGIPLIKDINNYAKEGSHIIVCTPGRMNDLLSRKVTEGPSLSNGFKALQVLILDEADRLLECGFTAALNTILAYLPKQRRTSLFSATQTSEVSDLIRAGLRNPKGIRVQENPNHVRRTPLKLQNFYITLSPKNKVPTLVNFLRKNRAKKILIFFSTCASVEFFSIIIKELIKKVDTLAIHGKMKDKRYKIFDDFRKLKSGILLCTDVMCRGVDIPQIDWVIQFEPPSSAASFVHRCGRTARSGLSGSALVYLMPNEIDYVKFIELNQQVLLTEHPSEKESTDLSCLKAVQNLQLNDRGIMDKANRAFVSYIRAYQKHECNIILKLKEIDLGALAAGYGLLRFPKMPELKNYDSKEFSPVEIDFNSIEYANPLKEQARKRKLEVYNETGQWPGMKKKVKSENTVAWSKSKKRKEKKKLRKMKKKAVQEKKTIEEVVENKGELHRVKKFKMNDAEKELVDYYDEN